MYDCRNMERQKASISQGCSSLKSIRIYDAFKKTWFKLSNIISYQM